MESSQCVFASSVAFSLCLHLLLLRAQQSLYVGPSPTQLRLHQAHFQTSSHSESPADMNFGGDAVQPNTANIYELGDFTLKSRFPPDLDCLATPAGIPAGQHAIGGARVRPPP